MSNSEFPKLSGRVNLKLLDAQGNIKEERTVKNLIVTVGLQYIAARMKDTGSPAQMTHMAIGTGTADPAAGQTNLGTLTGSRQALTTAGGTVSANKVTYTAVFDGNNGSGAISEAGIFNNGTDGSGTMLCRTKFNPINKAVGDSLTVTWEITVSAT